MTTSSVRARVRSTGDKGENDPYIVGAWPFHATLTTLPGYRALRLRVGGSTPSGGVFHALCHLQGRLRHFCMNLRLDLLACPLLQPGNAVDAQTRTDRGRVVPLVSRPVVERLAFVLQYHRLSLDVARLANLEDLVVRTSVRPVVEGDELNDVFDHGDLLGVRQYRRLRLARHGSTGRATFKRGLLTTVVMRQRWSCVHRILPRKA